jgi:DNA-binding transcriptional ArsR family regulator
VTDSAPTFEDRFAALGEPNRRRIVELLATRPQSVGEFADGMSIRLRADLRRRRDRLG